MSLFIDVHSHVSPFEFPAAPNAAVSPRWPCMQCQSSVEGTLMIGESPFRKLDARSWDVERRIEDMDRDGVDIQVLSPMPELLSYWLDLADAQILCDAANNQIASMVSAAPGRFRGLGSVPLQHPETAARMLPRLKTEFGLKGVEIGSNINGKLLGYPEFDPFWEAAEAEGMAVFVHALHPVAAKNLTPPHTNYTGFALFPVDTGMTASSIIMGGVLDRFPRLRIAFSHGGGTLGAMIGRLQLGWSTAGGADGGGTLAPIDQAKRFFYDTNVYDPEYLTYLATRLAPGQVLAGTDYPYQIMQQDPARWIRSMGLPAEVERSICSGAAGRFLSENF
ncbi:MAG: amidohydrolase family protein, partial [Novosphingobium sp.]